MASLCRSIHGEDMTFCEPTGRCIPSAALPFLCRVPQYRDTTNTCLSGAASSAPPGQAGDSFRAGLAQSQQNPLMMTLPSFQLAQLSPSAFSSGLVRGRTCAGVFSGL